MNLDVDFSCNDLAICPHDVHLCWGGSASSLDHDLLTGDLDLCEADWSFVLSLDSELHTGDLDHDHLTGDLDLCEADWLSLACDIFTGADWTGNLDLDLCCSGWETYSHDVHLSSGGGLTSSLDHDHYRGSGSVWSWLMFCIAPGSQIAYRGSGLWPLTGDLDLCEADWSFVLSLDVDLVWDLDLNLHTDM